MSTNRTHRINLDQLLISGLKANLPKGSSFVLQGEKHAVSEILAILASRVEKAHAATLARASWLDAVKLEDDEYAATKGVIGALRRYLEAVYGPDATKLATFGITPHTRRELTTPEKMDRIAKAKATREARHTMGKRQKATVKGIVADVVAPAAANDTTAPANGSTANGTATPVPAAGGS
jgi:hypothetical protein